MLRKTWFRMFTKQEISKLRGGRMHNFYYSVGISDSAENDILTDTVNAKLLNQMASQRSLTFIEGYEPFAVPYGTAKFCVRTMTIPVPRLKLYPVGWPNPVLTPRIITERKPACVINPRSSEERRALTTQAEIFAIRHRIRRHAAASLAKLDLILCLMEYQGAFPHLPDPADRFEAYLGTRSAEFLRDLLAALDMPDRRPTPPDSRLPQAA